MSTAKDADGRLLDIGYAEDRAYRSEAVRRSGVKGLPTDLDLRDCYLTNANLTWANLTGATLSRADLSGANLTWANLTGATLSRADLSGANLTWADLTDADLSRADLSGANLSRADLSGATLTGANLRSVDLREANLNAVHYVAVRVGSYLAYGCETWPVNDDEAWAEAHARHHEPDAAAECERIRAALKAELAAESEEEGR